MKEYTYTNKAYLGIKEGVVPPAPQYLWLNSKDDKLYKFGDNGWEVTNNAPYIVEDFTVRDIVSQSTQKSPQLTISRAFLDAMYKGVPIMVRVYSGRFATLPIIVDTIDNPSGSTRFYFRLESYNNVFEVSCNDTTVITGNKPMNVTVTIYNSVDWNENDPNTTGYIANRTHYLTEVYKFKPSQTFQLTVYPQNDIEDYRVQLLEDLYKLPKTKTPVTIGSSSKSLTFELVSIIPNNNGTLTYTYSTTNPKGFYDDILNIYRLEKPLDLIYLHNEALTWNYKTAQVSNGSVKFNTINVGDTLYNKDLVMIDASGVTDRFYIEIGVEHYRPNSIKEYTFVVYNNTTDASPQLTFGRGEVSIAVTPTVRWIGNSSPNCEIHVKLISYGEDRPLAVVEYKPFNS